MRLTVMACALLALTGCLDDPGQQRRVVTGAAAVRGCDLNFQVVNQSSATLDGFHFGPSSQQSWGLDRLGSTTLPPGSATNFRTANTGLYDFRAVWRGGHAADVMRVDVCRMSRIVVTKGGLRAI